MIHAMKIVHITQLVSVISGIEYGICAATATIDVIAVTAKSALEMAAIAHVKR